MLPDRRLTAYPDTQLFVIRGLRGVAILSLRDSVIQGGLNRATPAALSLLIRSHGLDVSETAAVFDEVADGEVLAERVAFAERFQLIDDVLPHLGQHVSGWCDLSRFHVVERCFEGFNPLGHLDGVYPSWRCIRFQDVVNIACPVNNTDDLDASVRGTVEDQVIPETFDPPDA